jgi:hypothetical protein
MADIWATPSNVTEVPIISWGRQMEAEAGAEEGFSSEPLLGQVYDSNWA